MEARLEKASRSPRIAIVGAGFSGLGMAIGLKRAGFSAVTIYEKAASLGGTWRDNSYPGAGCDIPSHLYCFSFALKPGWSRRYSNQAEILAYLEHCTDAYDVRRHILFSTEIAEARLDEKAGCWRLRFADGDTAAADILIAGCGQLDRPRLPDIPGYKRFAGTAFHSARWDHSHDFTGARVAVIGNGASAIQFIPHIARRACTLTIFQRSANWIIPRKDRTYSRTTKWLLAHVPGLMRLYRAYIYWAFELRFAAFHRKALLGRYIEWTAKRHMRRQVPDPALWEPLTPDFPVGCKRILISDDFYPALARENVRLVDKPIERIEEGGPVTADGKLHPVDAIVYATGFHATDFLAPIEVVGRGGQRLAETWRGGAEAYLGVAVAGFPNLFLLYGPNTNLGHNSILFMVEAQIDFIIGAIQEMRRRDVRSIDVREDAMRRYNATIQAALERSVWAAGCGSWYKTADGKITNNWPGYTISYWRRMRRPAWADFIFGQAGGERESAG